MRKRLILKMGIKVLLCSSVFSKKNPIFWGPYFLDNLMIKSTEGKIACEKVPSLLTEWLLESLFLFSRRCKIIVQVQYWKLVTRLCVAYVPQFLPGSLLEIKRPWRKWTRKLQLPSLLEKWWWGDNQCVAFLLKCFLHFIQKSREKPTFYPEITKNLMFEKCEFCE